MSDCSGVPHTFHAEYSTAPSRTRCRGPRLRAASWQQEIGHAEVCKSVTNKDPFSFTGGSQTFSDPNDFDTCVGGSEGKNATGEGPCDPQTGICQNAETQGPNGPVACPTNDRRGALCESPTARAPEGHPHGHHQRLARDGGVGGQHLPGQPVPER